MGGRDRAQAARELLPLVYDELRRVASRKLAEEAPGQTLQATALVHEAYLRLVGGDDPGWDGRGHFFAAAAEAMRRILVEAARRKHSPKHGGGRRRIDLDRAHRVLKPTKILVESHDGKPVPKVIDFGLAKTTSGLQLSEHSLFTTFGSVNGTPLYMAPEQEAL